MTLSGAKAILHHIEAVQFQLEDGSFVPESFHVTEVGAVRKHFIDCGGTVRSEAKVAFQLWNANETRHRLKPQKLLNIIALSEKVLALEDWEIEVEYQRDTIGKYSLGWNGKHFLLKSMQTACLAGDACGVPQPKKKIAMTELPIAPAGCTPGGGCC